MRPVDAEHEARITGARRLGVFPGTFDPLTRAHLAVAEAALASGCDVVVFVVPHDAIGKEDRGGFEARVGDVASATAGDARLAAATTEAGLYVEIAAAASTLVADAELAIVAGADKIEQIFDQRYYDVPVAEVLEDLFEVAELFVAPRGDWLLPNHPRVRTLDVHPEHRHTSASEIRRRRAAGEDVEHLLPSRRND